MQWWWGIRLWNLLWKPDPSFPSPHGKLEPKFSSGTPLTSAFRGPARVFPPHTDKRGPGGLCASRWAESGSPVLEEPWALAASAGLSPGLRTELRVGWPGESSPVLWPSRPGSGLSSSQHRTCSLRNRWDLSRQAYGRSWAASGTSIPLVGCSLLSMVCLEKRIPEVGGNKLWGGERGQIMQENGLLGQGTGQEEEMVYGTLNAFQCIDRAIPTSAL